jgi:hypothetical protein
VISSFQSGVDATSAIACEAPTIGGVSSAEDSSGRFRNAFERFSNLMEWEGKPISWKDLGIGVTFSKHYGNTQTPWPTAVLGRALAELLPGCVERRGTALLPWTYGGLDTKPKLQTLS